MSTSLVRQARKRLKNPEVTEVVVGVRRPKWALPAFLVILGPATVFSPAIMGGAIYGLISSAVCGAIGGVLLLTAGDRFCVVGGGGPTYLFTVPKWAFGPALVADPAVVTQAALTRTGRILDTWSINEERFMMPKKRRDVLTALTQVR